MLSVKDEPISWKEEESLGLDAYAKALSTFIKGAETPLTIGIQGQWGSGKTSLMNGIKTHLENYEGKTEDAGEGQQGKYWTIDVNTWEHSLLVKPEEALIRIIKSIAYDIAEKGEETCNEKTAGGSKQNTTVQRGSSQQLIKVAMRFGARLLFGDAGGKAVDETYEVTKRNQDAAEADSETRKPDNAIGELRVALQEYIDAKVAGESEEEESAEKDVENSGSKKKPKKIVVFVDDLDRLEPSVAVRMLELLKNIFNVRGCIFILAIDYDVVVKGLKQKFGDKKEENEWEFRAFFDKIIQLPFTMPLDRYDITSYVRRLLADVDYIDYEDEDEDEDETDRLEKLIQNTIGGNPRAIKRLMNSLSLIKLLQDTQDMQDEKEQKEVTLAMVATQIAAPQLYKVLSKYPDFPNWNDEVAFDITQGKEEDDPKFEEMLGSAKKRNEIEGGWKEVLFRICFGVKGLRNKVKQLTELLQTLEKMKNCGTSIANAIEKAIKQSAVTNVPDSDDQQQNRKKGSPKGPSATVKWVRDKINKKIKEEKFNYQVAGKEGSLNMDLNNFVTKLKERGSVSKDQTSRLYWIMKRPKNGKADLVCKIYDGKGKNKKEDDKMVESARNFVFKGYETDQEKSKGRQVVKIQIILPDIKEQKDDNDSNVGKYEGALEDSIGKLFSYTEKLEKWIKDKDNGLLSSLS